jgi:hypothetical protein
MTTIHVYDPEVIEQARKRQEETFEALEQRATAASDRADALGKEIEITKAVLIEAQRRVIARNARKALRLAWIVTLSAFAILYAVALVIR